MGSVTNTHSNESLKSPSPATVSTTFEEVPENSNNQSSSSSPLTPLDKETEKFLRFPPSNQQTLECEWYKELINRKRLHAETFNLAQSTSTSKQAVDDGNTVFQFIFCVKCYLSKNIF